MNNFWKELPRPFFALAPLDDVTDAAFRFIVAKYGKPDVMYTEFVSADGLVSEGRERLSLDLIYDDAERPIVAQLFGKNPEKMREAARYIKALGYDGVDINMGCPVTEVCREGSGAALIQNPSLAQELILAAREGAAGLPISVKTRAGYNTENVDEWMTALLSVEPDAIALHARTKKEMSKVPARWNLVGRAVELRDEMKKSTLIIGNGDVRDIAHGRELAEKYKCDGVMLGRAIFGNPWLFHPEKNVATIPISEKLSVLAEHVTLYEKYLSHAKSFMYMKKHFKSYIGGFDGAKEFRMQLMEAKDANEVLRLLANFSKENPA